MIFEVLTNAPPQEPSSGRRMSVQLSSAIKEGLHGTVASNPSKQNLLRRASMQPANADLSSSLGPAPDMTTSTLLPLIKRCVVESYVSALVLRLFGSGSPHACPSILKT